MDLRERVTQLLENKGGNYILPFFWQHGEEEAVLREYMKAIRNLKFRTNFGYNFSASSYRSFSPKYHLGDAAKRDNNSVYQSMSTGLGWTFENTLSYDFTIKDTHTLV